jgi:hypothetical protein
MCFLHITVATARDIEGIKFVDTEDTFVTTTIINGGRCLKYLRRYDAQTS